MSYNTITESYRIKGIENQYKEAEDFFKRINLILGTNYRVNAAAWEQDVFKKIDVFAIENFNTIRIDVKCCEDNRINEFSLTVIANRTHENYFNKTESNYLLFANEMYFYFVKMDVFKEWVRINHPPLHLTKHSKEDSQYIWVPVNELNKMENIVIIKK